MQLTLDISLINGDRYQVKTNLYTIVALERKFKIRASDLEHGVGIEHLAFLAYESSKQHGVTVPIVFDDFIKSLASVDVVEADPVNPSGQDPSATH